MRPGQNAVGSQCGWTECGRCRMRPGQTARGSGGLAVWGPRGLGAWRLGGVVAWTLAWMPGGLEAWTQTLRNFHSNPPLKKVSRCADIQDSLNDLITLLLSARAGSFRLNATLLLLTQCVWHARSALVRPTCNAEPISGEGEKDDVCSWSSNIRLLCIWGKRKGRTFDPCLFPLPFSSQGRSGRKLARCPLLSI